MVDIILSNMILMLGVVVAAMALTGLRTAVRERRGQEVSPNPFNPFDRTVWLKHIIRIRVAALCCGLVISVLEIWHQYYHYMQSR